MSTETSKHGATAKPSTTSKNGTRSRLAVFVGTASFVAVLAAAGAPIAMYPTYRSENGFTNTDFAVTTFGYLAAVVLGLLVFGRLSDYLGRRVIAWTALVIALAGCVLFLWIHDPNQLLAARVLQGLACGLAPSCLGAYVSETAPANRPWIPAVVTGSGFMIGISTGAITAGTLIEYAPLPRQLVYLLLGGALCLCIALLAWCPETVVRTRGVLRSMIPRLRVPASGVRPLVTACIAAVATWPLGGFYQAFAPSVAVHYFASDNALVGAVVFASVLILNPLGALIVGRRASLRWIRMAMALFSIALAGLALALHLGNVGAFIAAGLVIGLAQGMASTGAMAGLLRVTMRDERAGVLSTVYVVSYLSTTQSVLVAGMLTARLGLDRIMYVFVGFGILAAVIAAASTFGRRT